MFLFARVCMHLSVGSTVQTGRCFMRGTAFHFALPLVCSDCRVYVHCEHPPLLDSSTSIHFAGFNGDYAVHMAVHFDRAGLQQVTKYLRPACVHDCSNYDHRVSSSWCWHQPSPLFLRLPEKRSANHPSIRSRDYVTFLRLGQKS